MSNNQPENVLHSRVMWLTRTGILIALLVTLQWLTVGTQAFAGQYITGTCVNCVLAVAALLAGLPSGVCVALISPFLAFFLKIGPGILPIVPCIAAGNFVFVLVLHFMAKGENIPVWKRGAALFFAGIGKFLVLYVLVTKLFIPLMEENLSTKQVTLFTAMFSWPQLITALLGGFAALSILPIVQKAIKKRR